MPSNYPLARTAEEFYPVMKVRLNSLDVETALGVFDSACIMIDAAGAIHRGLEAIGGELEKYFSLGLQMDMAKRHLFTTGDTALLICDWSYDGIARDGTTVNMKGTASDVIRRGDDGIWRYIIDNPFGTQRRDAL
ncbi:MULTISPECIES: YybH family protein [Rhizobium]|uniref:DUF4440 domain-containing protein n=1 Tax=Rhizobium changzhiense TaxID=2692317 RepID=A0A7Z0UI00_9HYPH|nr:MULTISPECIES: DUF4440 domain-containing protein [Rhizobium]MBA5800442.1 DUF4440 domain-containing protein [Rhizobium changzhiense]MCH4547425.1 DUF4440 domain-containing protein [Rhizobium changzhiense]MCW0019063.1 DUF4440 domain-containing protein [Rhizobium sp. BT-226]NZD66072.1 DUF4440 domain-containing protein [Rhizobium changzhiense]